MKLKTEHVLPYVLHGVEFITEGGQRFDVQPCHFPTNWHNEFGSKLVLRPLSDLNKEIVINGDKHQMWLLIDGQKAFDNGEIENMNGYKYHITKLSYEKLQHILKFHFDVFGLIPKGLAVDINTL